MSDSSEFLVRDHRMPGHFWADNEVYDLFGPELGAYGFAVYLALCRSAINGTGECRIATSKIAQKLAISKSTVHGALRKIVEVGLICQIEPGGPRTAALFLLADVKSLTDPSIEQTRLARTELSVRVANAERSCGERSVRPSNHQANAAFSGRTPNKEVKTFTILQDSNQNPPNPPFAKGGTQIELSNRDRRRIAKYIEDLRTPNPEGVCKKIPEGATFMDCLKNACADLLIPLDSAKLALSSDAIWRRRLGIPPTEATEKMQ